MKIRNSFVSNSSSSSFIVRYDSVVETAIRMLKRFNDDWKDVCPERSVSDHPKYAETMKWLNENPKYEKWDHHTLDLQLRDLHLSS